MAPGAAALALPGTPFTDPVLIVAIATSIFLVVPLLFERLRVPGIIGLIVVGAAVGPHGAGLLARDQTIVLLGTVGLLYLMLMVGLELDLDEFSHYRRHSITFGTLSWLFPQLAGAAIALALGYTIGSALLLGAVFASHTLLAFPIASRLGIVKNEAVTTTLGGTILTEVLALGVLAFIAEAARGATIDLRFFAQLLLPIGIYTALVLWGIPRVGRWFFRHVRAEGTTEFVFVMAALFSVAYAAHLAHLEPIIGALLAGLALNRLIPHHGTLMNRIQFVGDALFIPFFLLSVGMLVDVRALDSVRSWAVAVGLTLGVILSKALAAWVTARVYGWSRAEGWTVFGLSTPHAAGTLAIVLIGFELGLFDQAEVNGAVLMILVTCLAGPWVVERWGRAVALQEERKPYDPGRAPRRILIPISNPATADNLMDLAILLRGRDSGEPLHPLMVVAEEGAEAAVAEAERMMSHAVLHAAGADVPVVPLTRVDSNIAQGIARGAAETRSTTVVIGWDGRLTGSRVIFGTVLDQLLDHLRQLVMVTKLGHPLNTTQRVILILPPGVGHHQGVLEALRAVNAVANGAGAAVHVLVVGEAPDEVRALHAEVRPQVSATWEEVRDWSALSPALEGMIREDDLVVALSARRGTLHWSPVLERLPGQLAQLLPESFIVVYPPETAAADAARHPAEGDLFSTLPPERVLEMGAGRWETELGRLAHTAFPDQHTARLLSERLIRAEREFSTEVLPGVIVPHARAKGLRRPLLMLGWSREGVRFPHAREPVRLVFLLVSPADRPEDHLRSLAEIARLLSTPDRAAELVERLAPGLSLDFLNAENRS